MPFSVHPDKDRPPPPPYVRKRNQDCQTGNLELIFGLNHFALARWSNIMTVGLSIPRFFLKEPG
jgi:hypothetical protein